MKHFGGALEQIGGHVACAVIYRAGCTQEKTGRYGRDDSFELGRERRRKSRSPRSKNHGARDDTFRIVALTAAAGRLCNRGPLRSLGFARDKKAAAIGALRRNIGCSGDEVGYGVGV